MLLVFLSPDTAESRRPGLCGHYRLFDPCTRLYTDEKAVVQHKAD